MPLAEKLKRAVDEFQSPAGFFDEHDGPDFGYVLHTTHSDFIDGVPLRPRYRRWAR